MLRETRARGWSRRAALVGGSCVLATALIAAPASADTYDNDGFESFPLGTPVSFLPGPSVDPNNWSALDPNGWSAANFDIEVVDPTSGPWGSTFGNRALRISNGVYSGAFGNQLTSPSLADEAGEAAAKDSDQSGGTRQSRFSGVITFASATQTYQPNLEVSISPDDGNGTRMGVFYISDQADGLMVEIGLLDYSIPSFVYPVIASGLARDQVHTIEYSIDFVDGTENDVLWLRIGGECGTWNESGTWETYHRIYGGGGLTHPVDSLLFRISANPGAEAPNLLGNGLLFDQVSYTSETVPPMPPIGIPGAPGEPEVEINGDTVTVVADPAPPTNGCVPVTEYTATLWPIPGGTPITFTSPTPTFSFPAPPIGNYDVTVSATNAEGTGDESLPGALTVVLAEGDDELANSGPTEATLPMAGLAAALATLGIGLVFAGRPRRIRA